ncbi:unnamed protein product, partial [Scytosiphon promiscuus]
LLELFVAIAIAITKARLFVWKLVPLNLRPRLSRVLRTWLSSGRQANTIFLLRHSNDSEKLRWVLELSGEDFREVPVAIFLARSAALYRSLGAGDKLPVISGSEDRGDTIKTVPAFIEHLSKARWRAWMYPEGSHELEDRFQKTLGPAAMNVALSYLFHKDMERGTMEMFSKGLPLWQKALVRVLWGGLAASMNERLKNTQDVSSNLRVVEKIFGQVERILSDGRRYLCGDSISVADIAFASLAFPLLLPEETVDVFVAYDPEVLPRGYVEAVKSLRSREGGAFARRLYREKRTRKGGPNSPGRSPRRGRSFTLKKNVNSPSQATTSQRGDRRATITHTRRSGLPAPLASPNQRASFAT